VHQVVREDEHRLYGFPEAGTRDLFRLLLTVRGVGPAAALGLLSGLPAAELVAAIQESDVRKLTSVKGIGKKTAEQLLLDLRDKILSFRQAGPSGTLSRSGGDQRVEDAVAALVGIGFSEKEARKSVDRAVAQVGGGDVELLVRTALAR
jgi:Holliday junction DNA helicase RuvA